ncbi:MAG: GNAT family N-acetyltransferase [Nocardioidaceae bacterium]
MARRVVALTSSNIDDLHPTCRACVTWELSPVAGARATHEQATEAKRLWVHDRVAQDGTAGAIVHINGGPAGWLVYAPPDAVPGVARFATGPVTSDAFLLVSGMILPDYRGAGLGRLLVQHAAKQMVSRDGVRALEAFGDYQPIPFGCVWPAGFLSAVGFEAVRDHPRHPRMRLDLRATVTWRPDVEAALARLRRVVRPDPVPVRLFEADDSARPTT